MNRVISISYPDTSKNVTFGYDAGSNADGLLTSMTDESGSTTWAHYVPDSSAWYYLTWKAQVTNGQTLTTYYRKSWFFEWEDAATYPSGQWSYNLPRTDYQIAYMNVFGTPILSNATYEPFGPVNGWTWGNSSMASFVSNRE